MLFYPLLPISLTLWPLLQSACQCHQCKNPTLSFGFLFTPRNFKGFFFWPAMHFDHQVWRWVIVPSELVRSFGAICTHCCYLLIHHVICVRDLSPHRKGNSRLKKLLGELNHKKIRRYNNSPPYVMARWLPQQIPLNFLSSHMITHRPIARVPSLPSPPPVLTGNHRN